MAHSQFYFLSAITAPADVLRARLMSAVRLPIFTRYFPRSLAIQTSQKSSIQVLRQALRDEGPRFLFKGWTPAFVRLGPNTVLMFIFFEVGSPFQNVYIDTNIDTPCA